jgi:GTP pyrophosphokinase
MTTIAPEPTVQPLLDAAASYLPADRLHLIEEAYEFAAKSHAGQQRLTGDPYIVHPLDAAMTLVSLQMDPPAIAAALLHDVQEDCGVPNAELKRRFGAEVAKLVDGATKLEKIAWRAPDERPGDQSIQAENLRKMFLAMAEDIRVVIIKLADRLHNMRTLDAKPPEKRIRTAQETMEIYAPLANRLGIWQIKWELEDLAFRYLEPERYKQIARLIQSKRAVRERYIAQVEKILKEELHAHGIEADVKGRAKHIYSIAQKAEKYAAEHKTFEQIYDLLALRVIVKSVGDCYNALGVVHGLWHPISGQFDDYIASPKESLYQSLHTTVMGIGARPLEVQIRTQEMHQLAEYGVAAHWAYKEAGSGGQRDIRYEERMSWLRQLLEWQRDMSHAEEFVESVKADLFQDQVFIYTPKGEIKEMPSGATPIDFAYRVHTELGHRCVGAKVNGRLVPLNYELHTGDVVDIVVSKASRGPSRDWLNANLGYIKTGHSREKIRQWFKKQERAENIERGRETIDKELRRLNLSLSEHGDEILAIFKYDTLDDFLAAIGYGGVSTAHMAMRLAPLIHKDEEPELPSIEGAPPTTSHSVQVLGTGDLLTQIARCCKPVPGDRIIGYVTRSRGVTIHRDDCWNVLHEDEKERLVDVEWGRTGEMYPVAVHIDAWDRVGLLRDISTIVSEEKVNMMGVRTEHDDDRTTQVYLTLETTGVAQLSRLMAKLESVRGVITVNRQLDGNRRANTA